MKKYRRRLALCCLAISPLGAAEVGFADASAPPSQPYTWKSVAIVAGGFMPGIEFHPTQKNLAYIRADMGGAYRWNAGEKLWIPLIDWAGVPQWNDYGIESLAVDPSDPNRVFMASGTYTNTWAGKGCMLRSGDQGQTWKSTPMPFKMGGNEPGRSMGERLAVDPNDRQTLFFGSRHNGLWKSDDGAVSWTKVESFPIKGDTKRLGIGEIVFDPRSGSHGSPTPVIYAGAEEGADRIYRSIDAGKTWQPLAGQPHGLMPQHIVLASDRIIYISYSSTPGPNDVTSGAVWKLNTADSAWTDITPEQPTPQEKFGYAGLSVDAQHPQTVMVSTLDRWTPGDDILRSTDGGKTWKSCRDHSQLDPSASPFLKWGDPQPKFGWWIGSVEIDPFDSNHVLFVTGATVWGCDDITQLDTGNTIHWSVAANGIEQTAVVDLISPPSGPHLISALGDVCGFRHDDLTKSPAGGMMSNPIFSTTTSIDECVQKPELLVRVGNAGDHHGAISTDTAATWHPFPSEPAPSRDNAPEGGSVAISADGQTIVWATEKAPAARSTDMANSWSQCNGLPLNTLVYSDPTNADRFYAIDSQGGAFYISTDKGQTFRPAAHDLPRPVSRLRILPGTPDKILLPAEDAGLVFSTDAGQTFSKWPGIEQANAIGFGAPAPGNDKSGHDNPAIFLSGKIAGTYGVFRSDDAGQSWVRINDDAHQYGWPHSITGDPRIFGRVYLGTNGRGILYADPAR
jgi:photosystem II stability/assembly factor-like uncharacterized protein